MAKDTKTVIVRTLLNIAAENGNLTIEEISRRSHITRTTIRNNFKTGIQGIVEYIYLNIVHEVNERLLQYDCEEVSLDILADLLLPALWRHKEEARVIYNSQLPFRLIGPVSDTTWKWAEKRFNFLIKEHGLSTYVTGQDLLKYFNAHLIAVLTLWLSPEFPIEPELFKPKFIFLMETSTKDLIYKGIN